MPQPQQPTPLETLAEIRDLYIARAAEDGSDRIRNSVLLATTAFNAASQLKPAVLSEIFGFYDSLSAHNGAALRGTPQAGPALADTTLVSLTQSMVAHVGATKVDPQKMPWQYRK